MFPVDQSLHVRFVGDWKYKFFFYLFIFYFFYVCSHECMMALQSWLPLVRGAGRLTECMLVV